MEEKDIKILVVEDDNDINNLLSTILKKRGYNVTGAFSGTEGKLCLKMESYDLVILDLMLPGMKGEDLISEIRESKVMPVIVISAKTALEDKVNLLKLGADDYITKPFEISEVVARVEAQLRRFKNFTPDRDEESANLTFKDIVLDKESRTVTVDGKELNLTVKEFEILELMISRPKKVFTRENIYKTLWDEDLYVEDNTVNVHISNIRNKIAKINKDEEYIKTIWGIGFSMAN